MTRVSNFCNPHPNEVIRHPFVGGLPELKRVLWTWTGVPHGTSPKRKQKSGRKIAPRNGTHCGRGHEFTPENTYYSPSPRWPGERQCRKCKQLNHERRKARRCAASASTAEK